MSIEDLAAKAAEATRLLKLLANERRLMVLCQLQQGEMTVGALARQVGLSQSALSQHLARLRRDGLVTTRRERQTIHYRLADPAAAKVIGVLYELYCSPPAL
jgi:DNA-binding transcriptional ArsR family regulator